WWVGVSPVFSVEGPLWCLQWWVGGSPVSSVVGLSVSRGESAAFSGGSVSGSGALRCFQWWVLS
ncbi:hypothetical protein NDU88_009219, partial [Pleurodeles waltl]